MQEMNIYMDLGTLSVYDSEPVGTVEESIQRAVDSINKLVSRLNQLKVERFEKTQERKLEHQLIDYDSNPDIVELPVSEVLFPRFRKIPSKES